MEENKDMLKEVFGEDFIEGEPSERQWRILEAAINVFSQKGYEASRTSDIAKKAEVAEGTIFRYYKTKKDLLVGLLFPMVIKFFRPLVLSSVEKILKNRKNQKVDELLEEIFLDRVTLVRKNMSLIKTIMVESIYHPELLEPMQQKIVPKVVGFIDDFVKGNISSGDFREVEPRLVTRTFVSMLIGYILLTEGYPEMFSTESDKEEVEAMVEILLYGISDKHKAGGEIYE